MPADRMPVEHQMLDAAGAPGAWPTHLLVDRLSAVLGERDSWRRVAERCESERQALQRALVEIERTFGNAGAKRFPDEIARDALAAITDAQEGTA